MHQIYPENELAKVSTANKDKNLEIGFQRELNVENDQEGKKVEKNIDQDGVKKETQEEPKNNGVPVIRNSKKGYTMSVIGTFLYAIGMISWSIPSTRHGI